jgi:sigma-B regulation protein RsbU (phosphoserine phosphatase)
MSVAALTLGVARATRPTLVRDLDATEAPVTPRFHAISIPRRTYTGDFWFARPLGDTLWFALGDVAGKGAASAVWMAMIQEELDALLGPSMTAKEPCSVVRHLDEVLREELPPNRFATLVVGRLEPDGSLTIANAGHPPVLIVHATGTIERITSNGPPVGILPNRCWGVTRATLEPGDLLVAYSDGLPEARTIDGAELGIAGAETLIASVHAADPRASATWIADQLTRTALVEDDVTLLVVGR